MWQWKYEACIIICIATEINFNKEFTFWIESTSSLKCVDPQTAISSVRAKNMWENVNLGIGAVPNWSPYDIFLQIPLKICWY